MKILVLGASGMLGHMLCREFSPDHDVYGTCHSPSSLPLLDLVLPHDHALGGIDCTDEAAVRDLLDRVRPRVVCNCVGIVKQLKEAHDAILSIRVNALLPHLLARACDGVGARLIHFSTDCVFSGRRGNYTEADNPDPVDLYGRSKLLGEVDREGHLTVRTSIIGRQLHGATGLIEWFLGQRGGAVRGFTKAIYTGLTTAALARVLRAVIADHPDLGGVWQIAADPIDKYDLLCRLNRLLDLGTAVAPDDTFACDRSLDGTRFRRQTDIPIPSWDDMLTDLAKDAPRYESWRH